MMKQRQKSSLAPPIMMKQRQKGALTPCCSKVGLKQGPWTPEEDKLLAKFVQKEGEGPCRPLLKRAGLKLLAKFVQKEGEGPCRPLLKRAGLLHCGKGCRLQWMNFFWWTLTSLSPLLAILIGSIGLSDCDNVVQRPVIAITVINMAACLAATAAACFRGFRLF